MVAVLDYVFKFAIIAEWLELKFTELIFTVSYARLLFV